MVYTLTLNPSLDYIVRVPEFKSGEINRSEYEAIYPGGKGINVSIILRRLGIETKAFGFKAGFTGDILDNLLKEYGVIFDFIPLESGNTRINIKLKTDTETEINGNGADITAESLAVLFDKLDLLTEKDLLVMGGSVPKSAPDGIYGNIIKKMNAKGVKCIVDAEGEALKKSLEYKPFLIKPNLLELSALFGLKKTDRNVIIESAYTLQRAGAKNVLVSMSEKGAVLISETGKLYEKQAPSGIAVNSTGSGDSMVAGFIAGWLDSGDFDKSLALGIAAGSASAFKEQLAEKTDIMKLFERDF